MRRGRVVYRVFKPGGDPKQDRTFAIVSRQALIDSRFSSVVCAPLFSNGEGLSTQIEIGPDEGLKGVRVRFMYMIIPFEHSQV